MLRTTRSAVEAPVSEPLRPEQPAACVYPWDLDDDRTLVKCADRAQARMRAPFSPDDGEVLVEHDPSLPEPWGPCGWVEVGGEVFYYGGTKRVRVADPVLRSVSGVPLGESYPIELRGGGDPVQVDSMVSSDVSSLVARKMMGTKTASVVGTVEFPRFSSAFVVRGKGREREGATFVFEDPSLFDTDLAYWDPDVGSLFLAPIIRGGVLSAEWLEEPNECETPPGVVPPSTRVVALTRLRRPARSPYVHRTTTFGGPFGETLFVRSPIVAEHYNGIVSAVEALEKVVGTDASEDRASLDWRLRELEEIGDECDDVPEIFVSTGIVSSDSRSTTVSVEVVAPQGTSFSIDFGDGSSANGDDLVGTEIGNGIVSKSAFHCYRAGALVEPSVIADSGGTRVVVAVSGVPPLAAASGTAVPTIDGVRVEPIAAPLTDDSLLDQVPSFALPLAGSDLAGVRFSTFRSGQPLAGSISGFAVAIEDFASSVGKLAGGFSDSIGTAVAEAVKSVQVVQNFGKGDFPDSPCFAIIPCESSGPS